MDVINYILSKKLKKYVDDSVGNVPDEKITEAVNTYLDENPVAPGATSEQAEQIQNNTNKIAELKGDITNLESILRAIQEKLNTTPSVDSLTVNEINDMIVEYFENKTVSEVEA